MSYSAPTDGPTSVLTIDVEDWFHILDSTAVPTMDRWDGLESRVEANMDRLLEVLAQNDVRATLFWLGWVGERHRALLRKCARAGHEIASHGYGHVLAHRVGRTAFRADAQRGKSVLEDILGQEVAGFRAPGFGIRDDTLWAFEEIRSIGHAYDSSVFPSKRAHGGLAGSLLEPYIIRTDAGNLIEIPQAMISVLGIRLCLFGGGYLRLALQGAIRWAVGRVHSEGRPLIVYIHPREIDPDHPRLPLSPIRRFKCYVNLRTTMSKLRWLCQNLAFSTMIGLAAETSRVSRSIPYGVPTVTLGAPATRVSSVMDRAKQAEGSLSASHHG